MVIFIERCRKSSAEDQHRYLAGKGVRTMPSNRRMSFVDPVAVVPTRNGRFAGEVFWNSGLKKVSLIIWISGRKVAPCFPSRCASSNVTDRRVPRRAQGRRVHRMAACVAMNCGDANTYTVREVFLSTPLIYLVKRSRYSRETAPSSSRLWTPI